MIDLTNLGYSSFDSALDEGMDFVRDIAEGRLIPLRTSILKENQILRGFLPTDQIVFAGKSGAGKTSRAIALMKDFLDVTINPHYAGRLVLLYDSWEISAWRNGLKFIGALANKTMGDLLNWDTRLMEEELKQLELFAKQCKGLPLFIKEMPDSVDQWEERKALVALQYPYPEYQVVSICDHTRLIDSSSKETSEEALITSLMKASIRVKKENNHINIFLSQLNRNIENSTRNRADIGNTLPQESDIFGSSSIFQASEFVIVLHRPGIYGLTQFNYGEQVFNTGLSAIGKGDDNLLVEVVLKNRNGVASPILLHHDIKYNQFFNYNDEIIRQRGLII